MTTESSSSPLRISSIRWQIILGFGLILGLTLIIVLVNFVSLRRLQVGIDATVNEASRVRELGLAIENQFLSARQDEQAFLNEWRAIGFEYARELYVVSNQSHLADARQSLDQLDELLQTSAREEFGHLTEEIEALNPLLDVYESAFQGTVDQIEERISAGGVENQLVQTLDRLEAAVTPLNDAEFLRLVLQLSANEQAFFNTGEQQYVDQTRLLVTRFKDLVEDASPFALSASELSPTEMTSLVDEHAAAFTQLVNLERDIDNNVATFQDVTSDISELTGHITEDGQTGLIEARQQLDDTVRLSNVIVLLAGLVALAIGVATAVYLGRRILGPMGQLSRAARQIGQGNLTHRVNVPGEDEFARLGNTFNQMAAQLYELIGSLEQLVAARTRALTTSFRVSRRLSTILDQSQLVAEVVEQVRAAFDYYHVHIYLFDRSGENLIMTGGTGEAGQAMLAARHRLRRGQGLVGKAAASGSTVLVPDVSQDPNWLPNPLLPGTKAEIAVPIQLGTEVLGVLDVQHDVRDALDESDAELLQSIANQTAIALQNARLYQQAQRTADHEALVNAINQKIQQAVTVEGVLQVAAEELGQALAAERTAVQLALGDSNADGSNGRQGDKQ